MNAYLTSYMINVTSLRSLLFHFPHRLHKNYKPLYQGCLEILEAS